MIKYNGKKHLNSNFYSSVSLIQEKEFIKVSAVLDERLKKVEPLQISTPVITEQIENLNEEDKIKEIVLYFLRNNKICELKQSNDNIVISAQNGRKLTLRLGQKYQYLVKIIIEKYKKDRIEYVYENDEDTVVVTYNISGPHLDIVHGISSYYSYINRMEETKTLVITLLEKEGNLVSFEKEFIMEYIKYIINNTSSHIISKRDLCDIKLLVDDRKIELPPEVSSEVSVLVFNRNIEIDEQKIKQLKLEDYYG